MEEAQFRQGNSTRFAYVTMDNKDGQFCFKAQVVFWNRYTKENEPLSTDYFNPKDFAEWLEKGKWKFQG